MLILTMRPGDEYVQVGEHIRIYVNDVKYSPRGKKIRVGIDAPKDVVILRSNAVKRSID